MMHIRQKLYLNLTADDQSYTVVDTDGFVGDLNTHLSIIMYPDRFELSEDKIPDDYQKLNFSFQVQQSEKGEDNTIEPEAFNRFETAYNKSVNDSSRDRKKYRVLLLLMILCSLITISLCIFLFHLTGTIK